MSNNQLNIDVYHTSSQMYGLINYHNLNRVIQTIDNSISQYGRVLAIRCDLRFADVDHENPHLFQNSDNAVITRFIESLKSQVEADLYSKALTLSRVHPTDVRYIWAREQDESIYQHYHVVILLNYNTYGFLGDYANHSGNLANKIQKAWCSAIGLPYPDYAALVHFPERPCCKLERTDMNNQTINYIDWLRRIAYLAKDRTKIRGAGYRNFGCSQF